MKPYLKPVYTALFFLGLFLLVAPFILRFNTNPTAFYISTLSGLAVLYMAYREGHSQGREVWEYWMMLFIAAVIIVASTTLNFSGYGFAVVSNVVIACIIGVLSWDGIIHYKNMLQK